MVASVLGAEQCVLSRELAASAIPWIISKFIINRKEHVNEIKFGFVRFWLQPSILLHFRKWVPP